MDPLLVFPDPPPPELAQALDLGGWSWKSCGDPDAAMAQEPDEGWAGAVVAADVDPGRHGNRHPSIAPYEPYRAADGMVAVAAASPVLWERFADVLGRPEWCDDPRFADNEGRVANVEALATEVEAVLVDGSVEEWVGRLQAAGIPAGPINDVRSAFATAEALGLDPVDVLGEGDGAFRSVRSPMGLSATPPSVRRPPPRNDQHGDEIRDGLGD